MTALEAKIFVCGRSAWCVAAWTEWAKTAPIDILMDFDLGLIALEEETFDAIFCEHLDEIREAIAIYINVGRCGSISL